MDLALEGCSAVVTGAGRGIGLEIVRALVAEGVRVLPVTRTRTDELTDLAAVVEADLADPTAAGHVAGAVAEFSPEGLDVLVNTVGGGVEGDPGSDEFADLDDARWARTIDLNLLSAVRMTRALVESLLRRGGTIVNLSSISARLADQPVDYGVTKAALNRLTTRLSEEYASRGLRAVTVSPGPTRTAAWTDPDDMTADLGGARRVHAGGLPGPPPELDGRRDRAVHRARGGGVAGRLRRLAPRGQPDRGRRRPRRRRHQGGLNPDAQPDDGHARHPRPARSLPHIP